MSHKRRAKTSRVVIDKPWECPFNDREMQYCMHPLLEECFECNTYPDKNGVFFWPEWCPLTKGDLLVSMSKELIPHPCSNCSETKNISSLGLCPRCVALKYGKPTTTACVCDYCGEIKPDFKIDDGDNFLCSDCEKLK
jgi:hypothetical protein